MKPLIPAVTSDWQSNGSQGGCLTAIWLGRGSHIIYAPPALAPFIPRQRESAAVETHRHAEQQVELSAGDARPRGVDLRLVEVGHRAKRQVAQRRGPAEPQTHRVTAQPWQRDNCVGEEDCMRRQA